MSALRFGISFPQSFLAGPDTDGRLHRFFDDVEAAGLHSVWVQEQLLGADPSLEPLTSLAYAAAATSSVMLGTATVVGPLRDPVLLAKSTATIDRLSGGRLILGLSIGEVESIYGAVGVDMSERGTRLDEAIDVLETLWTRSPASHRGTHWQFEGVEMEPKPIQEPHPQLWFGGRSKRAIRRATERGGGWLGAGGATLDAFASQVRYLTDELEREGRDRGDFTVAKKLYLAIDDDAARARAGLERWFEVHWPASFDPVRMAAEVGVAGTPDVVAAAIEQAAEGGADLIILNPVFDESEQLPALVEIAHRFGPVGDGS